MYFLKYLYQKNIPLNVFKSVLIRQQLLAAKTDNRFQLRLKTWLSILALLYTVPRRAKKTNAHYLIIDNFVAPKHIDLRRDFVDFFNNDIQKEDIVLGNHQYYFYRKLTLSILLQCFGIWFKFSMVGFANLFIKHRYPTNFYYYVAANLINGRLMQPKGIYIFQMYDTATYLSALLLQKQHDNIYLSVSNSFTYGYNRYTELDNVRIILCHKYQLEEITNFIKIGWFNAKSIHLWGPEEITEHNAVPVQTPTFDIGLYSTGYWARNGRNRERNVEAVRTYQHINNPYHVEFMDLLKTIIGFKEELGLTVKIYTHPLERDWFNQHGILPPFLELAKQHNIHIDLSEGNSLDKLHEVKIGIGAMSTVLLDRWHHNLESLILYQNEGDKQNYQPKFFGAYSKNFFNRLEELQPLIVDFLEHQ
jgi:hypothetical protein